jgi:DNA primase
MPRVDFRQARSEIRLVLVLELLGWQARERRGQQVRGACPLHGSTSPRSRSFSAQLGRGVWRCFVCGASGNALELWARASGQGLYQAVLDLCERLGREVPWLQPACPARRLQEQADGRERSRE